MLIPEAPQDDGRPRHVGADQPTEPGDARPRPAPGFPPPGAFPGSATAFPGAPPPGAFPGSRTGAPESWAALSGSGERARLPSPGERVGPYRVERELARGGMGAVYVAQHVELGRVIALKLMLADRSQSPKAYERFQIEAEAVGRLRHPGIVAIHEAGVHGASPFLAMEFVQGESLKSVLEREGPLEPRRAVELTVQLAEALEHAHQAGVLHRDLKPDNVLLEGGRVRITDFGLAKQLRDTTRESLTKTGQAMGTPGYMPPEQASGERHDFGFPSDVWGLGATLYALLTGRPPFEGQTSVQVITKILTKDPDPPSAKRPAVDAALDRICLTCLEKETTDRYPTMAALAADLRRYLAGDSVEAGPTRAQRRRHRRLAALILGLGGVTAMALVAFAGREQLVARFQREQAQHASERLSERAEQALRGIDTAGEARELAQLEGWLREFGEALGAGHALTRDAGARARTLRRLREARAEFAAVHDEPNVSHRHLLAGSWLREFDAPDADPALATLSAEVRTFHAERWLRKPLARIKLCEPVAGESAQLALAPLPRPERFLGASPSSTLERYTLPAGEPHEPLPLAGPTGTTALAWRDGSLWAGSDSGVFQVAADADAQLGDAAPVLRLPPTPGGTFARGVRTLTPSPDGQRALAAGEYGDDGTGWLAFLGPHEPVIVPLAGMVFSALTLPDGRYVTVGGLKDGTYADALVWRHGQREPLTRYSLRDRGEHVACTPDGETLAVGTSSAGVILLEVPAAGDETSQLRRLGRFSAPLLDEALAKEAATGVFGLSPYVYGVAFSPDGRWLLSSIYQRGQGTAGSPGVCGVGIWAWEAGDDQPCVHVSDPAAAVGVNGLLLASDGRFLAQPTARGELLVWDGPASMPAALRER